MDAHTPRTATARALVRESASPSAGGPAVELLGRLMDGERGDMPATPETNRELLATVLGLKDAAKLSALTAAEVRGAIHRLSVLARRLTAAAAVDDLTGALRRNAGIEAVRREFDRANREGKALTVAVLDVDGLKAVNDEQGHLAGDEVLRCVVAALRRHFRGYDVVLRYGGDEFVCALPGADIPGAARRFAAVQRTLNDSTGGRGRVSVGLAQMREGDTLEGLIARADADLYVSRRRRAPAGGRTGRQSR